MFEHQLKIIETKDRTQTIRLRMFVHTWKINPKPRKEGGNWNNLINKIINIK